MKKKILCIADSLGLPRPGVNYDQTWCAMIRSQYAAIDFISLFRRQATTNLLSEWEYGDTLLFYKPDEVILQLGICDCSPRYLRTTSISYRLLNKSPRLISNVCWKIVKLFFKRSIRRTDVSIEKFEENLKRYFEKCLQGGVERVIVIKIAKPAPKMIVSNPLVTQSVILYNEVYDKLAREYDNIVVVDPLCSGDDNDYVDGYHTNDIGHRKILQCLAQLFDRS